MLINPEMFILDESKGRTKKKKSDEEDPTKVFIK